MSTARVDLGRLPAGTASVLLETRTKGSRAWLRLGETTQSVSEWEITGGSVEVQATVRDTNGRLHRPGRIVSWDTEEALADEPLPKDVSTWPAPEIVQDGPLLRVVPYVAPGLDPKDYEFEVRQGEDSGAAKDGLQVGFVLPGHAINASAWHTTTGTQTIHTRAHRIEDGRMSDWTTTDFTAPTPIIEPTVGHSNDFASGTLETTDAGVAPLEISGGDLRQKAIYAGDLTGGTHYAGNFTDIYAGDADLYWSPASYTTATVTISPAEDIVLQVYPDMTSTTRKANLYAGDCHWPVMLPHIQTNGTYVDLRAYERSLQNGADETPLIMDAEVSINAGTAAKMIPGQVHSAVTSYAVTFTFKTFAQKRFTIDNLYVRHWIWCRARPWHSHSDAFEMIYENTLTANAATVDVSMDGDDFDEMVLQVLWKNANAAATALWLRPNNDSGANYDKDGGGDSKIVIGGGGTVVQNEWEDVRVRIHNPLQGTVRAFSIESAAKWTAAASDSSPAAESWIWTDTVNEMTSIRVLTAGGATEHIASGSIIRLWAKRHHEE